MPSNWYERGSHAPSLDAHRQLADSATAANAQRRRERVVRQGQGQSADDQRSKSKPKRKATKMESDPPSSCATASTDTFDDRLRDVFTLREATLVLNEYLSSIRIDDENPGFLFDWDMDNLIAFVDAANLLIQPNEPNAPPTPDWLQTQHGAITVNSFTEDLVRELRQFAGGACGRVLLAPNSNSQYVGIVWTLVGMCTDDFMQAAAQAAFGNAHRYLATTHNLTDTRAQRAVPNNLPPLRRNNQLWHRIFI